MENKNKTYTLKIRGKEVEVSEEIYREYIRPVRLEQRQKRREWKCMILSKEGRNKKRHYVRCPKQCETCPYYLSGQNARGNNLSLDKLIDAGADYADENGDIEMNYIENETEKEEYENLHKAIKKLTHRQQEIIQMIYFEGKTQEEVRKHYGIARSSMSEIMDRTYATLTSFLKNR